METNETMNISDSRAVIAEQLVESCKELFGSYEVNIEVDEEKNSPGNGEGETHLIGLLGVTAEGLRATVAIQTSDQILQDTFPADLDSDRDQKLQDWIGELSNQLLGRLKNKLIPYGCELTLGVPAVIQGSQLKTILPRRTEISSHRFITDQDNDIFLFLSTLEEESFTLHTPDTDTEDDFMAEGEILFF